MLLIEGAKRDDLPGLRRRRSDLDRVSECAPRIPPKTERPGVVTIFGSDPEVEALKEGPQRSVLCVDGVAFRLDREALGNDGALLFDVGVLLRDVGVVEPDERHDREAEGEEGEHYEKGSEPAAAASA